MTSLQINYFLKVAEYLNFSRAAEELYVSQPSVSRQIQQLEQELGCTLFDRTRKNAVTLTAAGLVFQDSFRSCVRSVDAARTAAQELSAQAPLQLRVGYGLGWDLSDILGRFRRQVQTRYPQAELEFRCDTFVRLQNQVQTGTLDAILCPTISIRTPENLEVTDLGELPSLACVRRGLLRPSEEPLRLTDFHGQRLLTLEEDEVPSSRKLILYQFWGLQVKPETIIFPNRDSIYQAVLRGEGFAVFDSLMPLPRDSRIACCPMEQKIPVCMMSDRQSKNPLLHLFGEAMSREFAETVLE